MKITLDKNLRELRLAAEMTQEELAESLSVSPQTVSRWETGVSCPDLGLLPTIAAMFEVSVDELLGVDPAGKRDQIERILRESRRFNNEGNFKERIAFLREKLAEFPDNAELGNAEKTLEALTKAADYAERYENRPEKYDVYWLSLAAVNNKKDVLKNSEMDQYQVVLEAMKADRFGFLRKDERFVAIAEQLRKNHLKNNS